MSSILLVSMPLFLSAQPEIEDAQKTLQSAMSSITDCRSRLVNGCRFLVRLTGTQKMTDGLKTFSSQKDQINLAPSRYIVESGPNDEKKPWPVEVRGFNAQYSFRLRNQRKEPLWVLADLFINDPLRVILQGRAKQLGQLGPDELVAQGILPCLEVESIPCERLLSHSSFKVKQIERDGNRVRIQFESDVQSFIGSDRILRGSLWLLPESSWVVDEYRVTILPLSGIESPVEMKMEWRNLTDLPEPSSAKINYHPKDGPILWDYQYSSWKLGEEPPERFTISHYGLPEPGGTARHSRWYLWAALAGIIALAVAALFRWLARRE